MIEIDNDKSKDGVKKSTEEKMNDILMKHQRDINRTTDEDKLTRKRGLEKLLSELPWTSKSRRKAMLRLFCENLMKPLLHALVDSVEKCRELSLKIIRQAITVFPLIDTDTLNQLIVALCARIGETPFPESTEELRLMVLEILGVIVSHESYSNGLSYSTYSPILDTLSKALSDAFPAVKREGADLLCITVSRAVQPWEAAGAVKSCLKALCSNAMHQHNKVRAASLRALQCGLACFTEDYQVIMRDQVLGLLNRVVGDRNVGTRKELASLCTGLVETRLSAKVFTSARQAGTYPPQTSDHGGQPSLASISSALEGRWAGGDMEVLKLLFVLCGDESKDVSDSAKKGLEKISVLWAVQFDSRSLEAETMEIEGTMDFQNPNTFTGDAEATVRAAGDINGNENVNEESDNILPPVPPQKDDNRMVIESINESTTPKEAIRRFTRKHLAILTNIMVAGIDGWTVDGRIRFLGGLSSLLESIEYCDEVIEVLPILITYLGLPIRDEEAQVRKAAEICMEWVGVCSPWDDISKILLPRAEGTVAGGDTASSRATALRLLTSAIEGAMRGTHSLGAEVLLPILKSVSELDMYEHREVYLREAAFVFIRSLIRLFPDQLQQGWPSGSGVVEAEDPKARLGMAMIMQCTVLGGESSVIRDAVISEASKLQPSQPGLTVLAPFTSFFLIRVAPNPGNERCTEPWTASSPAKAAFDVILRQLPVSVWELHTRCMPVIFRQVQPPERLDKDSPEGIAATYAAQRGEEDIPELKDVDVRLSLLALLESIVRVGASNWQCGRFVGEACGDILAKAVIPNLVWRVGRVEATIRKVALAVCHGLLRAGAAQGEAVFKAAPQLVPLLASNLDDHEAGPRAMSCMCLTVCFERLKGAFGDDAVRELYPKLLKRLDDSSDQVRTLVCDALEHFLVCAPAQCYKGTVIDYTLDQLFIHLDDGDQSVQEAVLKVVLKAAEIDKQLVQKKADLNRHNHRDPTRCDEVLRKLA